MINYNILLVPIWLLYNVKKIEDVFLDEVLAKNMRSYSIDERKYIHKVLDSLNEDFDFKEMMKKRPFEGDVSFSNIEIYNYLMDFKAFMEDDTFKLLEE